MARDATLDVGINKSLLFKEVLSVLNDRRLKQVAGGNIGAINPRTFTQPLGRIRGELGEFEKSLEASNARVIAFSLSAGSIYAVSSALKFTVRAAIEVEKKLTEIAVVMGTSTKGIGAFGNQLFDIASQMGASFDDAAKAALELSRQGLGLQDTLKRTADALLLARMSGLDAADAVSAITAAMNSFNGVALDSTRLVNQLAAVDMRFAVSSADLADAIKRVGSTASAAGLSIEQLIALVTAAQQTTQRGGAIIGNALKSIFTRLERPKVLEQLEAVGVQFKNLDGSTRPLLSVLNDLALRYDDLTDAQQSHISELVGGVYQMNILKAVLRDSGKDFSFYSQALKVASNATDEAQRRSEELNETLSAKLNKTLNNLTKMGASFGTLTFGPAIDKLLNSLDDVTTSDFGGKIATSILSGFGKMLSGPGLTMTTLIFAQLAKRMSIYLKDALSQVAGLERGRANTAEIERQVFGWLNKEQEVMKNLLQETISINTARQMFMKTLREETSLLRAQSLITKEIAVGMNAMGVVGAVKGAPAGLKIPVKAAGHIPEFLERTAAIAGGYKPGNIKRMVVDGKGIVYNDAEDVVPVKKILPGAKTNSVFIVPPKGSDARVSYDKRLASKGINPALFQALGYVPNLARPIKPLKVKDVASRENIRQIANPTQKDLENVLTRFLSAENRTGVYELEGKRIAIHGLKPEFREALEKEVARGYETMINNLAKTFGADPASFTPYITQVSSPAFGPLRGDIFEKAVLTSVGRPGVVTSKDLPKGQKIINEAKLLSMFEGTESLPKGILSTKGAEVKASFDAISKSVRHGQAESGNMQDFFIVDKKQPWTGKGGFNNDLREAGARLYGKHLQALMPLPNKLVTAYIRKENIAYKGLPMPADLAALPDLPYDPGYSPDTAALGHIPNLALTKEQIIARIKQSGGSDYHAEQVSKNPLAPSFLEDATDWDFLSSGAESLAFKRKNLVFKLPSTEYHSIEEQMAKFPHKERASLGANQVFQRAGLQHLKAPRVRRATMGGVTGLLQRYAGPTLGNVVNSVQALPFSLRNKVTTSLVDFIGEKANNLSFQNRNVGGSTMFIDTGSPHNFTVTRPEKFKQAITNLQRISPDKISSGNQKLMQHLMKVGDLRAIDVNAYADGYIPNLAFKYKRIKNSGPQGEAAIRAKLESVQSDEVRNHFAKVYKDYHNTSVRFAKGLGIPVEKFVDIFSAISPRLEPEKGFIEAARIVRANQQGIDIMKLAPPNSTRRFQESLQVTGANRRKALSVLGGGNVTGLKRTAFAENIISPRRSKSVTVDFHAASIFDERDYTSRSVPPIKQKEYNKISEAYRTVGKEYGLTGLQAQGASWMQHRLNKRDGAKYVRSLVRDIYKRGVPASYEKLTEMLGQANQLYEPTAINELISIGYPQRSSTRQQRMSTSKLPKPKKALVSAASGWIPSLAAIERIKMAALKMKSGEIYTGPIHAVAFEQIPEHLRADRSIIQGFMTTNDRFVDRAEALEVAKRSAQLGEGFKKREVANKRFGFAPPNVLDTSDMYSEGFAGGFIPNLAQPIPASKVRAMLETTKFASFSYRNKQGEVSNFDRAQMGGTDGVRKDKLKGARPPSGFKTWREYYLKKNLMDLHVHKDTWPADQADFRDFNPNQVISIKSDGQEFTVIPNLALDTRAVTQAIEREIGAGYTPSQVKVGFDSRIGPLVYNTTEGSATQAVDLHAKQGRSLGQIKKLGSNRASGHIPNLAGEGAFDNMAMGIGIAVSQSMMMRSGGYQAKRLKALGELAMQDEENLRSATAQNLSNRKILALTKQRETSAAQLKNIQNNIARAQRIQSLGMMASFSTSFVTGAIASPFEEGMPKVADGINAFGSALSLAATAVFAIPGPMGIAAGAAIGGLTLMSKGFHVWKDKAPALERQFESVKTNFELAANSINNFALVFSKLSDAYSSQKASQETIQKLHVQYIAALAEVPEQYRLTVASAASAKDAQDAVGEALLKEATKVSQLDLTKTLNKKIDASSNALFDTSVFDLKTETGRRELETIANRTISSADKPEAFASRLAQTNISSAQDFIDLANAAQLAGEIGSDMAASLVDFGERAKDIPGFVDGGAESLNAFAKQMQETAKQTFNASRSMASIQKIREIQARHESNLKKQSDDATKSIIALNDSIYTLASRGLAFANARATLQDSAKTNAGTNQLSIAENVVNQLGNSLSASLKGRLEDSFALSRVQLDGGAKFREVNTEAINELFNNVKDALNEAKRTAGEIESSLPKNPAKELQSINALQALDKLRSDTAGLSPEDASKQLLAFSRENGNILGLKMAAVVNKNDQIINELIITRARLDQNFREQIRLTIESNKINTIARRRDEARNMLGGVEGFMNPAAYKDNINQLVKGLGAVSVRGGEAMQGRGAYDLLKGIQGTLGLDLGSKGGSVLRDMAIQARAKEINRGTQSIAGQIEASAYSARPGTLNRRGLLDVAKEVRERGSMKNALEDARIQIEESVPLQQMPKDIAKQVKLLENILAQLESENLAGYETGAQSTRELYSTDIAKTTEQIDQKRLKITEFEDRQKALRDGRGLSSKVAELLGQQANVGGDKSLTQELTDLFNQGDMTDALEKLILTTRDAGIKAQAKELLTKVDKFNSAAQDSASTLAELLNISNSGNSHAVKDIRLTKAVERLPAKIGGELSQGESQQGEGGTTNIENSPGYKLLGKSLATLGVAATAAIVGFGVFSKTGRAYQAGGVRGLVGLAKSAYRGPRPDWGKIMLEEYGEQGLKTGPQKKLQGLRDIAAASTKNFRKSVPFGTPESAYTPAQKALQAESNVLRNQVREVEKITKTTFLNPSSRTSKAINFTQSGIRGIGSGIRSGAKGLGVGTGSALVGGLFASPLFGIAAALEGQSVGAQSNKERLRLSAGATAATVGGVGIMGGFSKMLSTRALTSFGSGAVGGSGAMMGALAALKLREIQGAESQQRIATQYGGELALGDFDANANRPKQSKPQKFLNFFTGREAAGENPFLAHGKLVAEHQAARFDTVLGRLKSIGPEGEALAGDFSKGEFLKTLSVDLGKIISLYKEDEYTKSNTSVLDRISGLGAVGRNEAARDQIIQKLKAKLQKQLVAGGFDRNKLDSFSDIEELQREIEKTPRRSYEDIDENFQKAQRAQIYAEAEARIAERKRLVNAPEEEARARAVSVTDYRGSGVSFSAETRRNIRNTNGFAQFTGGSIFSKDDELEDAFERTAHGGRMVFANDDVRSRAIRRMTPQTRANWLGRRKTPHDYQMERLATGSQELVQADYNRIRGLENTRLAAQPPAPEYQTSEIVDLEKQVQKMSPDMEQMAEAGTTMGEHFLTTISGGGTSSKVEMSGQINVNIGGQVDVDGDITAPNAEFAAALHNMIMDSLSRLYPNVRSLMFPRPQTAGQQK